MPNVNTFHLPRLHRLYQTLYKLQYPLSQLSKKKTDMDSHSSPPPPHGLVIFSTVGRTHYGFDIFSLKSPLHAFLNSQPDLSSSPEHRLTDGASVNFNGQFLDEDQSLVFVSERSGCPRIYSQHHNSVAELPTSPDSMFHDRPVLRDNRLYYISAHQPPEQCFTSWSALYSTGTDDKIVNRLTPSGCVDYSPAISRSGRLIAVASYGNRIWPGEFHDLSTDIVVFPESDPSKRTVVCEHGGWPTWSGDSTIYFHRRADDGWWSIYRIDLPGDYLSRAPELRVTPPGVHCFTPAAVLHGSREVIAVATRRPGKSYRHIELFDVEWGKFYPVTELLNPKTHHYNPFFSPEATFLGYHRFRGSECDSTTTTTIPYLDPVISPEKGLRMQRLNGSFPSFSPSGDYIAFNQGLDADSGLKIVKSDGSKRWTLFKGRVAFCNSWSPAEPGVIFTSIGPIFDTVKATVQIARVSFDPSNLTDSNEEIPGVETKILTKEETGNNAFPSCSPDGKQVVFRSGRSGHKNLYIMDAVKGESLMIRQLTEGPWIDTMPSWSPDGNLIAFSSNRHNPDNINNFSIYVIHPDGTGLRRIHVAGPEGSDEVDKERLNHVCFSQDCEWLLFTGNLHGVTAEPVSVPNQFQPYGDLYIVKLDGSGLQRLTWNGYENGTPAWHPSVVDDIDLGRLTIGSERKTPVGDKLRGDFQDVLWLNC